MLSRRQLIQYTTAASALATLPTWAGAAETNNAPVLWGPPVAPTVLLALAAEDHNLQQRWPGISARTWRGPDQLRAGLTNHDMPLTMVPSYVAANFRNQGQDVGLLNIMTFGLLYIIGKNDRVKTLDDLVGRKLVMPFKQDMPDLVLQALLTKAGIKRDALNIQYTATPPEAMLLFMSGQADLALLPEPAVSMAQIRGKQFGIDVVRSLDLQSLWGELLGGKPRIPQAGLLTTRAFYDQHADLLAALKTPIADALKRCAEHPEQAAKAASAVMKLPAPVLAAALPHSNLSDTAATAISDEILAFFDVLYRLNPKITGGKPADDSLFWALPQA